MYIFLTFPCLLFLKIRRYFRRRC